MRDVARTEGVNPEALREKIAEGSAVIMLRGKRCTGIGKGLSTKVNVNLGTSSTKVSVNDEIQKAIIAETFGADTISDLSMGGDINAIRNEIFSHTTLPITTVPVYQAVVENGFKQMTADDIMATFRMQAGQGISSVVIHGVSREMLTELRRKKRLMGMVSKGGALSEDLQPSLGRSTGVPMEQMVSNAVGTAQAAVYSCPMHPEVKSDKPGKCPKCGMTLVTKPAMHNMSRQ